MALRAFHRQAARQRTAAAILDHVAGFLHRGRLADDAVIQFDLALFERLYHAHRAVGSRAFFIGSKHDRQRTRMIRMLGDEIRQRYDKGGQRAFHVGSAATVQDTIANGRLEGITLPLLDRAGRHHIGVTSETNQRRCGAATRPQIVDAAHADFFADKTQRLEDAGQQVEATGIGRRDRGAGNQLFGKFEGIDGHGVQPS